MAWGAVAGYGFYQARDWVGDDRIQQGIALSYLSASITENIQYGDHALSYLRYGLGPVGVRVSTPLAEDKPYNVAVEWDFVELGYFANALTEGQSFGIRDGIINGIASGEGGQLENHQGREANARAYGSTVIMEPQVVDRDDIWRHEAVHVTQAIQYGSLATRYSRHKIKQDPKSYSSTAWDFRIGYGVLFMDYALNRGDYTERWHEQEAERMANDQALPGEVDTCGSSVSFGFSF